MKSPFLLAFLTLFSTLISAQDSIVLKDLAWDKNAPAGSKELFIPSADALLAGFIYQANGIEKHPTLILLHGYPGNERNLDLAQVVRAHGWNVIYFDYSGSWASQGKFSFKNSVADVKNVVAFCNKYQDSLKIDTSNIALFGHSMGAWICLKVLQDLAQVKKGFALSTWNIYGDTKAIKDEQELAQIIKDGRTGPKYFVLNSSLTEIFYPAIKDRSYFDLEKGSAEVAGKQIIMLDEHPDNKEIAESIQKTNHSFFEYQVWDTDHGFTNKRVSLIKKVISFLDR